MMNQKSITNYQQKGGETMKKKPKPKRVSMTPKPAWSIVGPLGVLVVWRGHATWETEKGAKENCLPDQGEMVVPVRIIEADWDVK